MRRLLLGAALLAGLVLALPALAEPGRVVRESVHEEFFNEIEGFCDTDMLVESHLVVDGRTTIRPRGRDGLIYFANRLRITETYTNVDNGNFIVSTVNLIDKD